MFRSKPIHLACIVSLFPFIVVKTCEVFSILKMFFCLRFIIENGRSPVDGMFVYIRYM